MCTQAVLRPMSLRTSGAIVMGTSTGVGEMPPAKLALEGAPAGGLLGRGGGPPASVLAGSAGDAPAAVHGCTFAERTSTDVGGAGLAGDSVTSTFACGRVCVVCECGIDVQ